MVQVTKYWYDDGGPSGHVINQQPVTHVLTLLPRILMEKMTRTGTMMLPESCLPIVMFVPGPELTRDRQLFLAVSNHHDIRQPAQANCDTLVKTHCQLKIRTFLKNKFYFRSYEKLFRIELYDSVIAD